ncbi:nucleotide 5'-monophosphate nucleosidase PpnN [Pleionea sp. CnH1-48]|nr:nucleotide 5'-monophosphate nucleosidase PpnN [Pleionea sp. CnH1-48]
MSSTVHPVGSLDVLSQHEVELLCDVKERDLHRLLRLCSLAVLSVGSEADDCKTILEQHKNFDIQVHQTDRGVKLELVNAPAKAFVDDDMITGIQEHLFSVLRDLVYSHNQVTGGNLFDLNTTEGLTNACFHLLRNAGVLRPGKNLNLVTCWGGHAISRVEYDYTKEVGYQLGLRGMDVCTGCGPGAMKGPMKGAAVAHAKQRIFDSRYIGISEPGIIAAEAPNPIVNKLVIMPDIEKRLEAFVRLAHAIIIFPGGAGTAEELLYLLGILLHPKNKELPFPLILTGPESSRAYLESLMAFVKNTLGDSAVERCHLVCGDPVEVSLYVRDSIAEVREFRKRYSDAYFFNWRLHIPYDLQIPFNPTHESMAKLNLTRSQPVHELASHLRRAFSGIVAGNIKAEGVRAIEEFGPFQLTGEASIMDELDVLLKAFVDQKRMKIGSEQYTPCYELTS